MKIYFRTPLHLNVDREYANLDQFMNHGFKPVITSGKWVEAAFEFLYARTSS
jgi:hypothetical protein